MNVKKEKRKNLREVEELKYNSVHIDIQPQRLSFGNHNALNGKVGLGRDVRFTQFSGTIL